MSAAAELIKSFKQVKTLPHIVTRLIVLINDEESTLQDFEEVIRLDPALVARLLQLVNSSYFGLRRNVDSISRAVALLGMKNLHNIAVTNALKDMIGFGNVKGFSPDRLWMHSAASGICCKMIAERIFTLNGDDAYLCGILHDIGLIVEMIADRDHFAELITRLPLEAIPITDLERELFGSDHCEIGRILAEEWQIPAPIVEAIGAHHQDETSLEAHTPTGILQMSEYIINQLGFSLLDNVSFSLAPSLSAHIQKNVAEYKVLAEDLPEELEQVNQMYGS